MSTTFRTSRRFNPGYAWLYRWLHRWTQDRLRAGALHIFFLSIGIAVVLLAHFLTWALAEIPIHDLTNPNTLLLWGGTVGSAVGLALVGLVGVQPALVVRCGPNVLRLEQGSKQQTIPHSAIESVSRVSATTYHRHYRHYRRTKPFIGVRGDTLVLVRTGSNVFAIGLNPDDQDALCAHLETAQDPARTEDALAQ